MSTDTLNADAALEASSEKKEKKEKPETYKISIGRQLVLWLTFLIFLPFFISLPVMIFMRIAHQQYIDAIPFSLIFLFSFIGILFIILQILAAGRQRIELYNDKVALKLPTWRGPTPMGPAIKANLPYQDIETIEKRGEIYILLGLLGLREVSSIVTKDGKRYVLGYVTENEADAPIPYNKVTTTLAAKVGKEIIHKGAVNGGSQFVSMFVGSPSWDTAPLKQEEVDKIRKRAQRLTLALVLVFFAVVIGGMGLALYPEIIELLSTETTNQ